MKLLRLVFGFALLGNRFAYTLRARQIVIYTALVSTYSKLDGKKTSKNNSAIFDNFVHILEKITHTHTHTIAQLDIC